MLEPEAMRRRRQLVALVAILFGGVGAHKFMLGKAGQGLVYLLFCFTFIPMALGLFEGLTYLSMKDEDFAARYPA